MYAPCFFRYNCCVLTLDIRSLACPSGSLGPFSAVRCVVPSAQENFVHTVLGVYSRVLSVVLIGFCPDVVFPFVGGILHRCWVLFWGPGAGEDLSFHIPCIFLGASVSCHGWFLILGSVSLYLLPVSLLFLGSP